MHIERLVSPDGLACCCLVRVFVWIFKCADARISVRTAAYFSSIGVRAYVVRVQEPVQHAQIILIATIVIVRLVQTAESGVIIRAILVIAAIASRSGSEMIRAKVKIVHGVALGRVQAVAVVSAAAIHKYVTRRGRILVVGGICARHLVGDIRVVHLALYVRLRVYLSQVI